MALRAILTEEDELLRQKSREVVAFDGRLAELLDDMWETMRNAGGVGLAAPQVGILRRAVVIDVTPTDENSEPDPNETYVYELINPTIETSEGSVSESEGCLSVPGISGVVARPERVLAAAFDRNGNEIRVEGTGMLAKAICHEVDHLNGILFTDIAESLEEVK